jgi:hypothetical protein
VWRCHHTRSLHSISQRLANGKTFGFCTMCGMLTYFFGDERACVFESALVCAALVVLRCVACFCVASCVYGWLRV